MGRYAECWQWFSVTFTNDLLYTYFVFCLWSLYHIISKAFKLSTWLKFCWKSCCTIFYMPGKKRSFSIIIKMSIFMVKSCYMSFCSEIVSDYYKVNFYIVINVSRYTMTRLKQLRFTLLSRHYFVKKKTLKCE